MSTIFWDTNLFIYLMEDHGALSERTIELRRAMNRRGDQLFTSTLTFGEVMVKPLRTGRADVAREYEEKMRLGAVLIPFDLVAARAFSRIRQDRTIKAPDAIQLACASISLTDLFITNDNRLFEKKVEGIQFILPLEKAFL